MPFILEADVSSTWRIARNWGLVADVPHRAAVKPPAHRPMSARDLLTQTLRAAGLYGTE